MIQRALAYVNQEWVNLLWPASLFLGVIVAGWAIRRILFSRLRRWTDVPMTLEPGDFPPVHHFLANE